MIWFTSDQHFGHENIIRYCNRPFATVEEMDNRMIIYWNAVISPGDRVFHLGDFTLNADAQQYFRYLNGHITVIPGDHDWRWMRQHYEQRDELHSKDDLVELGMPLYTLETSLPFYDREVAITLCHYAMRSWPRSHYNSWHLHGHHHAGGHYTDTGERRFPGKVLNVCADWHNFYPVSLDEVVDYMKERPDNQGYVGDGDG